MDKIMFDKETLSPDTVAESIINRVKNDKVRVSVVWEPGHTELTVEPWEPYKTYCPYSKEED